MLTPSPKETDSAALGATYLQAKRAMLDARRGMEVRRQYLRSELDVLEKTIAEVDMALAKPSRWKPTEMSVAELTRHVLMRHPGGVSAVAVIREVQAAKPDADPKAVHAALRHARKSGARRSIRYFPPEPEDPEEYLHDPVDEPKPPEEDAP